MLSYLRGPLTRLQVRDLMSERGPDAEVKSPLEASGVVPPDPHALHPTAAPATAAAGQLTPSVSPEPALPTRPPALPSDMPQVYLPVRKTAGAAEVEAAGRVTARMEVQGRDLLYVPALLGLGRLHFFKQTKALSVDEYESFVLLGQPPRGVGSVHWEEAQALDLQTRELREQPEPEALFDELPETINDARKLRALQKDLDEYLYRNGSLTLLYSPAAQLYSKPQETEREFRMRLRQAARELRDEEVDKLESRYADRIGRLEERLRRARATLAKKEAEVSARKRETAVSVGESVLGLLMGRRSTRVASTVLSKERMRASARLDLENAEENVTALQADVKALEAELEAETRKITERWEASVEALEEEVIRPRRTDVQVNLFALAWVPHWRIRYQGAGGIPQAELVPGY